MTNIVVIDNRDSFSHLLADAVFRAVGVSPSVVPNTAPLPPADLYILSPGPGHPADPVAVGCSSDALRQDKVPVIGVCLGHQLLGLFSGAKITSATFPTHGLTSAVSHTDHPLFTGVPNPFPVMRYHSLEVQLEPQSTQAPAPHAGAHPDLHPDSTNSQQTNPHAGQKNSHPTDPQDPPALEVLATADDGTIMAIAHGRNIGLQFHPESIGSPYGETILRNAILLALAPWHREDPYFAWLEFDDHTILATGTHPCDCANATNTTATKTTVEKATDTNTSDTTDTSTTAAYDHDDNSHGNKPDKGHLKEHDKDQLKEHDHAQIPHAPGDPNWLIGGFPYRAQPAAEAPEASDVPATPDAPKTSDESGVYPTDHAAPIDGGPLHGEFFHPTTLLRFVGRIPADSGLIQIRATNQQASSTPTANTTTSANTTTTANTTNANATSANATSTDVGSTNTGVSQDNSAITADASAGASQETEDRHDNGVVKENCVATSRHRPVTLADTPESYRAKILACQKHILDGDAYELCLTTRASTSTQPDLAQETRIGRKVRAQALADYLQLRRSAEAPMMSFFVSPSRVIASASPERFLKIDGLTVSAQPMKGTRPRGSNPAEDSALHEELANSRKDRAENLMIVDLLRNDLTRTAVPGTVATPEVAEVHTFARWHQMISTITATRAASLHAVITAAYPGGSMTGAPKQSAMDLLVTKEPARGWYSGIMGYFHAAQAPGQAADAAPVAAPAPAFIHLPASHPISPQLSCDFAMLIRSIVYLPDGSTYYGAGGAITHLSDPEEEIAEVTAKLTPYRLIMEGP